MFLDLHGHSMKKNAFTYGPEINPKNVNIFIQEHFLISKIFPKILDLGSEIFKYPYCQFNCLDNKKYTGRVYMFRHMKLYNSFTLETSLGIFKDNAHQIVNFNNDSFADLGTDIAIGLYRFFTINF